MKKHQIYLLTFHFVHILEPSTCKPQTMTMMLTKIMWIEGLNGICLTHTISKNNDQIIMCITCIHYYRQQTETIYYPKVPMTRVETWVKLSEESLAKPKSAT